MSDQERKESAAFTRSQSGRQWDTAITQLQDEIGEKLLPKLTELIPKIGELTPVVVDLTDAAIDAAEWLAENPFSGLGLVVNAFILKELAEAAIGATINKILLGRAAAGAGGAAADVATGAAGGAAGKAGGFLGGKGKMAAGGALAAGVTGLAAMVTVERAASLADVAMAENKKEAFGKHVRGSLGGDLVSDETLFGNSKSLIANPLTALPAMTLMMGRMFANTLDPSGGKPAQADNKEAVEAAKAQKAAAESLGQTAKQLNEAGDKLAKAPAANRTTGIAER